MPGGGVLIENTDVVTRASAMQCHMSPMSCLRVSTSRGGAEPLIRLSLSTSSASSP
jgi:hypothetical protein